MAEHGVESLLFHVQSPAPGRNAETDADQNCNRAADATP